MNEVVRFECRDNIHEIYIVKAGERLSIYGSCSILCLAGNASLNDFNLPSVSCEPKNFLKISAPQRMDIPVILQVFNSSYKHARLKFRLKEIAPKLYEAIMQVIGTTQPAVFVFKKELDHAEGTMSSVVHNFLIHSSVQKQIIHPPHFFISRDDFRIYPEVQEAELRSHLERLNRLRNDGQKTSILPVGHKGAGKSNLMRNLVNRCLSSGWEHVYVLDCDIGQSEFNPCGCLSLVKVNSPILDKPHGHQRTTFENSYFYGDITVRNIERYMDIFERLFNKFKIISDPGSICIINSMGWVIEEGALILDGITRVVEPDLFVEIYRDQTEPRYGFQGINKDHVVELFANNSLGIIGLPSQKRLPPPLIRDLTVTGYFSSLLSRPSLSTFSRVTPYKIKFSDVTIALPIDLFVDDCHIFSSINTQLMALCINDPELKKRRICNKADMPNISVIREFSPSLQCIGFGIIRAVNVDARYLFVVTPVDLLKLEDPPVLVRGMRIQTPPMFFTSDSHNRSPYVLSLPKQSNRIENTLDGLFQPSVNTTQFKRSRKC